MQAGQDDADVALQRHGVEVAGGPSAHQQCGIRDRNVIFVRHADEERHEEAPHAALDDADRTEIDQGDGLPCVTCARVIRLGLIVEDEVPRVQIRVEDSPHHNLIDHRVDERVGDVHGDLGGECAGQEPAERRAADALLHDHAVGAVLAKHLGDAESGGGVAGHGGTQQFAVRDLRAVVQFFAEPPRKLRHERVQTIILSPVRARLGIRSESIQDVQIRSHLRSRPRTLDLHDHVLAAHEARGMDLRDRCRSQRLGIDLGEHLLERNAQLVDDRRLRFGPRDGRRVHLERREGIDERGGKHVFPRRQHLAELDERHPGLVHRRDKSRR